MGKRLKPILANVWVKLLILAGVVLVGLVYRVYFSSINSYQFMLYASETNGYSMNRLLGILPKSYKERFKEKTLESLNGKVLINVIDSKGATMPNYIIVKQKKSESFQFLKAYPLNLTEARNISNRDLIWKEHVSFLINLDAFNEYINEKNFKSKSQIVNKYFYFLSDPNDSQSYAILSDSIKLQQLIVKKPLANMNFIETVGGNIIESQSISFENLDESNILCWLYNYGIVRFRFVFDEKMTILSVESEIVGYLGNETPIL